MNQISLNGEWRVADGLDVPWSDSFFHLKPGQPRRVTILAPEGLSVGLVREALRVHSLIDTYH
jgi:hypothetical protein